MYHVLNLKQFKALDYLKMSTKEENDYIPFKSYMDIL